MPSSHVVLAFALAVLLTFPASWARQAKRPMDFTDILAQRTFSEAQIRADGKMVAFLVKRARLEEDDYVTTLHVTDLMQSSAVVMLAEGGAIRNVRWRPGSGDLSYWDGNESRLVVMDMRSRKSRGMDFSSLGEGTALSAFEWSRDGARLAMLIPHQDEEPKTPYLYQDSHYLEGDRLLRETSHELVVLNADGSIHCRSGAARWTNAHSLAWGPEGGKLGFISYKKGELGVNAVDAIVIRATDCTQTQRIPERGLIAFGAGDSDLLSLVQKREVGPDGSFHFITRRNRLLRVAGESAGETLVVDTKSTAKGADGALEIASIALHEGGIIVEAGDRSERALYRVANQSLKRIDRSGERLSDCSIAVTASLAACIVESSMQAPEIGIVNLGDGSLRRLTSFNAHMKKIRLGKVERVGIPDDEGRMVTMYLVYPLDYREGKRYPAIVTMYGFGSGFVSQAGYITSYAPQVWAARGYVTLLWNYTHPKGGAAGDLAAQARDFQLGQFAVTQNAVRMLIERGLADPARIGVAGHSMGSHWSDYAIAHDDLFAAASSHAPGAYTPIAYWRGGAMWRRRLDHVFGGPPVGETLAAWQALSPAFFPPPNIPQLREVPDSEIAGEFALRHWPDSGAPVEMIAYPNETHVFHRPQSRLYSMALNTDWFDFWLRGVEDSAPEKAPRYERWRAMRGKQCARLTGNDTPWYCRR